MQGQEGKLVKALWKAVLLASGYSRSAVEKLDLSAGEQWQWTLLGHSDIHAKKLELTSVSHRMDSNDDTAEKPVSSIEP